MITANPHEVLELLQQLNKSRKQTREIARTMLEPDAVRPFIDTFTEIEDIVLDEIDTHLKAWIAETENEMARLRAKLDEVEERDFHPPLEDGKCIPKQ